eukprot:scaffold54460_cov27-Phaeocystis_antarctica.AAC.1
MSVPGTLVLKRAAVSQHDTAVHSPDWSCRRPPGSASTPPSAAWERKTSSENRMRTELRGYGLPWLGLGCGS